MSTTNIIGRKITGFEFPDMTDRCLWTQDHAKRVGKIGTVVECREGKPRVKVEFADGEYMMYPSSLIEQHLVPEEKSNNMNNTTDSQSDQVTKSSFNTRSPGFHCSVIGFPGVHKATFYGWDSNECQQRAQDFVNAEAYRVENERLRKFIETIEAAATLSVTMGVPLDAKLIMENVNHTKSYLK